MDSKDERDSHRYVTQAVVELMSWSCENLKTVIKIYVIIFIIAIIHLSEFLRCNLDVDMNIIYKFETCNHKITIIYEMSTAQGKGIYTVELMNELGTGMQALGVSWVVH